MKKKKNSIGVKTILDIRAEEMCRTIEGVIKYEIEDYQKSAYYKQLVEARQYTNNRSNVQTKTNTVASRSNSKIEHPLLYRLTKQKADFLLTKPFTVETKSLDYENELTNIFSKNFRKKLKAFGFGIVEYGINYWLPYIDEKNNFRVKSLNPLNVKVYWADEEHEDIQAFLYFYTDVRYNNAGKYKVKCAEYWDENGVRYFEAEDNIGADYTIDKTKGNKQNGFVETHLKINGKGYNWETLPIVWAKYGEELPLQYWIKELVDDINWQTSITSDTIRDIAKFIYIFNKKSYFLSSNFDL